ncbi:MAG: 2Fe-2S iron-sulfur cluster-binding protein [Bacteroidota bacterium]
MNSTRNYITFILIFEGAEYRQQTYQSEYRNLRDLISDKLFIDGFGECGGVGRCATCLVEIDDRPADGDRNEQSTLAKAGIVNSKVRLSCQIMVDDDLANARVKILDSV